MKKLLLVFGTRPEAIKMAPLVRTLKRESLSFDVRVCVTAQHRQMLDQVLDFFQIKPDYDLDLMKPGQTLNGIWSDILLQLKPILDSWQPEWVLVHGDTATSTAAALAAYFSGCRVAHVEAGLRTYNKWSPFPEEINRQLTGRLADLHFAPTKVSRANLLQEAIPEADIFITGNTVIDALFLGLDMIQSPNFQNSEIDALSQQLPESHDMVLVTGHRRENFGTGFVRICQAIRSLAEALPKTEIVYPVHLNPNVQHPVHDILSGTANIHLVSPLSYPAFLWAMSRAKLIITDSGGVQEEAPSLGKPVLVMRDTTERPEAVEAGTVLLVGTDSHKIYSEAFDLLHNTARYEAMSRIKNPYGDGHASERIANALQSR